MGFKGKYILAAIDGTGSHEWRNATGSNSHTYQFYQKMNLQRGKKAYWDGPGEWTGGVILGHGSEATKKSAINFINAEVENMTGLPKSKAFATYSASDRRLIRENYGHRLRVILVGHSRGGMIAITTTSKINYPIYFLALYDAVNMNFAQECDYIHNVDYTYHAMRNPIMRSRYTWGNCGTDGGTRYNKSGNTPVSTLTSAGHYQYKYFSTSHGGINGDPQLHPKGAVDDIACSVDTLSANIEKTLGYDRGKKCFSEAAAANHWILSAAKSKGLRF